MFASMTEDQRTRLVEVSIQQMEVDWMEKYKGKKTLIEQCLKEAGSADIPS